MIGKAEWFARRKYGGWGLTPRTWQGWLYVILFMLPLIIFHSLPFWSDQTRIIVTLIWIGILLLDVTHILLTLRKDELEDRIEAISERNASWIMVAILVAGILYEVYLSAITQTFQMNWFIVAALFGGMIAKSLSNMILERKGV